MFYIKNNRDYACTLKVGSGSAERTFTFDCKRIYQDTGNIVTTGVTPIDESDFEMLYRDCKQFRALVDKGDFVKTKKSGATEAANQMDALAKENELLKKQLEEKTKEASLATSKELEETKAENEKLKAQLEALAKGEDKNESEVKDESEAKDESEVDDKDSF